MVQITMSGLAGGITPILLTSFLTPVAGPLIPFDWVSVWLLSSGIVAMGLRDIMGSGDGESGREVTADEDFLGGDLGGSDGDEFDGFDEGLGVDDDPLADIEPRLDDLETELADVASTISSVRGEHESMRESVDEIEENIRKLLEVYEVVTQGANPFVETPTQPTTGGGAFGLLDEEDEDPTGDADEAESDIDDLFDDATTEEPATSEDEPLDQPDDDGLSFEELKSEFEFVGDDAGEDELSTSTTEPSDSIHGEHDRYETSPDNHEVAARAAATGSGKPYLSTLPGGYGAELLVMEWLQFLVSESSIADAMRAVRYYGTVDWISDEVTSHLLTVLSGTSSPRDRATPDGGLPSELSVDHHTRSLEYISRLGDLSHESQRVPMAGVTPRGGRRRREDGGV